MPDFGGLSDQQLEAEPHLSDFARAAYPLMAQTSDAPSAEGDLVERMLARRPLRHQIETKSGRVLDMSTVSLT